MVSHEIVVKAIGQMKRSADYRFFFEQLGTPDWIEPLLEEGFFREPPLPIEEGSYVRYPMWPESQYLARVAGDAPDLVLRVIEGMPDTRNPMVHADLIRAAAEMPVSHSLRLVPRIRLWLDEASSISTEESVFKLAQTLMDGEAYLEAIRLSLDLIGMPDGSTSAEGGMERVSRINDWQIGHVLERLLGMLPPDADLPALERISDSLAALLEEELGSPEASCAADHSSAWHPAVEQHEQNRHYDTRTWLVDAIRDLAVRIGSSEPEALDHLVDGLIGRRWAVFTRIALYLCGEFPESLAETRIRLGLDRELFESADVRHEYYWLIHDWLNDPTAVGFTAEYLNLIDTGPPTWLRDRYEGSPDANRAERSWMVERLHPVRQVLPEPWFTRYREWVGEVGEPEHPDFVMYMSPVRVVADESPVSLADLLEMPVSEVVDLLRQWTPTQGLGNPSVEGLGRRLVGAATKDPSRFAAAAEDFRLQEPTYVRSILDGIRAALQEGAVFDWEPVLSLGLWVLEQEDAGFARDDWSHDPDWSWARRSLADLVSSGLDSEHPQIPVEHRAKVWGILRALSDDSQPSSAYEQQYGGSNMDPMTLSLNTIRGSAFHAMMRYPAWLAAFSETVPGELPDELATVLDEHLDVDHDPSLAVRSVYGWGFGDLVTADPSWAQEHVTSIFPSEISLDQYRRAAWDAFLWRWRPSRSLFELLLEQYELALLRLAEPRTDTQGVGRDPEERFASHLLTLYWWGVLGLGDGGLWDRFLDQAGDDLLAYVIREVGQIVGRADDVPQEVIDRSVDLWDARYSAIAEDDDDTSHQAELAAFAWWFPAPAIDPAWLLDSFLDASQRVEHVDASFNVVERLPELVESHPLTTLKVLRVLIDKDEWGHVALGHVGEVRQVLSLAMRIGGEAEEAARRLINWLAARGLDEYGDLLNSGDIR